MLAVLYILYIFWNSTFIVPFVFNEMKADFIIWVSWRRPSSPPLRLVPDEEAAGAPIDGITALDFTLPLCSALHWRDAAHQRWAELDEGSVNVLKHHKKSLWYNGSSKIILVLKKCDFNAPNAARTIHIYTSLLFIEAETIAELVQIFDPEMIKCDRIYIFFITNENKLIN